MLSSIILIFVFTFLNAVFASAEIAVISMKESRLKYLAEHGGKKAKKLQSLVSEPSRFLATIQVAITLSGFLNSAFAADNFSGPLVDALLALGVPVPASTLHSAAVLAVTLLLAYISIVLGELVPKRIAMKYSEQLALGLAPTLYGISRIFSPLVSLLTFSSNLLLRLLGIHPTEDAAKLTKEEIQMILTEGNEHGIIDTQENELIQNVFDFHDVTAEQICTHRLDVVLLNADDTPDSWHDVILSNRYSCYPVYQQSKENIIGLLDVREYFRLSRRDKTSILEKAVKPAFFVPETIKAAKLFHEMKHTRNYFSILLNEYGEMSGIVTMHDLVEELVGEIYEEDDAGEEKIKCIKEGVWKIRGDADVSDIRRELQVAIPEEDFDTFNGLIYHILGKIPKDDSQFHCEAYGMNIHVHTVKNHKILEATVTTDT